MISILKLIIRKSYFELIKFKKKEAFKYSRDVQQIVKQVKEYGYCVSSNFYSPEECTFLRKEIDRIVEEREIRGQGLWLGVAAADKRCFGAERDSDEILDFFNNSFALSVAENYFGGKISNSNTLAAKLNYKKGNAGSGDGWHRDAYYFQFKAIVYLSDVELKDGPFQMIEKSHRFRNVLKDTICMNSDIDSSRYTNRQVNKVIQEDPRRLKKFTAKAGTLIFADTSSIHAGLPLKRTGERYALTNYYFQSYIDVEKQTKNYLNAYRKTG
jgi:hypothetical protein